MVTVITEDEVERILIAELQQLGYSYVSGQELSPGSHFAERDYTEVILKQRLQNAMASINPHLPSEAHEEAMKKVMRSDSPDLIQNNYTFHRYLTDGVEVEYRKDDRITGDKVWLIDYENPDQNEFLAVNQFTVIENNINKRPDLVLFVNGMPLVVVELKNAAKEGANIHAAFNQLQTYKQAIPSLFHFNALLMASDGWEAIYGSLTATRQFFQVWKTIDGQTISGAAMPQMEVMAKGLLSKKVLLDVIRHFTVFQSDKESYSKIIARYHQYYAVNKALETTEKAVSENGNQRAGVIWHTQGSGKSLTMVFYTGKLVLSLSNPTIVVLTDRNDLDNQLFDTFSLCKDLLRQSPVQAGSREELKKYLSVTSGGVVFSTIQKFFPETIDQVTLDNGKKKSIKGSYEMLTERKNVIVIADEAHRSQYDFIDGFARHMRDALPGASFIGFTGTPIETTDKNTQAVFGDYIDVYDIQQAVEDGATVRIYYENRIANIKLKDEEKPRIDQDFEELTESEEISNRQKLKLKWARLEAVVGNEHRVDEIAKDLVRHFEQRAEILDGKAMVVCMSRRICVDMYNAIVKIKPKWHSDDDKEGAIKVVMTGSSSDPKEWQPHIRNKDRRKAIGERLKDPRNCLKLVIVRDMWLTGFDAPCLHTLYVDKPMKSHNLMQAIARVNRVFTGKDGGLIVDYIGMAAALKSALANYTESGGKGKPAFNHEDAAMIMMAKYEIACQLFEEKSLDGTLNGFSYKQFFSLPSKERLSFPILAADFILGIDNGKERYLKAVTELVKAFALAVPHRLTSDIRDDVGFFQAVKARIVKVGESQQKYTDEELDLAVKQIVSSAIVTEKVIDIYKESGISSPDISILSEEFLAEIKNIKHKNVAFELLKRLINDELKIIRKTNLSDSRKFSKALEDAINKYKMNLISSAEVIKQLMELGNDMRNALKRGEELGLDYREYAFYTALEVNDSAVKILGDEILRHIAQELVKAVKRNTSIDWEVRENVQATMRVAIKRILKKYDYPPDKTTKAVETVIEQAKLMAPDFTRNGAQTEYLSPHESL